MKRNDRIIKIIVLIIWIVFSVNNLVYASGYLSNFEEGTIEATAEAGKVRNALGIVLTIVRNVGASIAVIMLLVLGSKYMIASAADRAEIKKHAIIYVLGAVVLFASSAIIEIIKNFIIDIEIS